MTKLVTLALTSIVALSLAACGGSKKADPTTPEASGATGGKTYGNIVPAPNPAQDAPVVPVADPGATP